MLAFLEKVAFVVTTLRKNGIGNYFLLEIASKFSISQ